MTPNMLKARLRVGNELGAALCRPFVVLSVGPAKVDMDQVHERALLADWWRTETAKTPLHPMCSCTP